MNAPDLDPLDEALDCLARDDALELPDPRLGERLLRGAHARLRPSPRSLGRGTGWSRAAVLAIVVGVSGLAVGSTVGFDTLRAWWYSIVIDGREVSGTVDGAGASQVEYVSVDGYRVSVRVARREMADSGSRTSIDVREEGHGTLEHTVEEIRRPGPGSEAAMPRLDRLSREALGSAQLLHTWMDPADVRWALWMGPDPDGPGSRLLLDDVDSVEEWPVHLTLRTARHIASGGQVLIEELPDGWLDVALSDGCGWEIVVRVGGDGAGPADMPDDLTTPSGRVRVRVGD